VDSAEPEDIQDIDGHLRGGIPEVDVDALGRFWAVAPSVRSELFESAGRDGYCRLRVAIDSVAGVLLAHEEFQQWRTAVLDRCAAWARSASADLCDLNVGDKPKALIGRLSEGLLEAFAGMALIDGYDVFQRLMDYWAATLQDDCYLVAQSGWAAAATPRLLMEGPDRSKEAPDFVLGKQRFKSDLMPRDVLSTAFFSDRQDAIENLEIEVARLESDLEALAEDQGVEGGLLEDVIDDRGKISKNVLAARLKEIAGDVDANEERTALASCGASLDGLADAKARLKTAREELDRQIAAKYGELGVDEVKTLVVTGKWLERIEQEVHDEIRAVEATLVRRISELAERYATPLPAMIEESAATSRAVRDSLIAMGAEWP
jgi:type I restriction enzyme M protein